LIAADLKETKDAMEDGHPTLLNMLLPTESLLNLLILMLEKIKLARLKVDLTEFHLNKVSVDAMA
jgi:hypothetical protein